MIFELAGFSVKVTCDDGIFDLAEAFVVDFCDTCAALCMVMTTALFVLGQTGGGELGDAGVIGLGKACMFCVRRTCG